MLSCVLFGNKTIFYMLRCAVRSMLNVVFDVSVMLSFTVIVTFFAETMKLTLLVFVSYCSSMSKFSDQV